MFVCASESVTITCRDEPAPGYCRLGFLNERIARSVTPGQFVHIACGDQREMFLRRPFSHHRYLYDETGDPAGIEILFRVKGRGTRWLADLSVGATLDVIGPLGSGFQLESNATDAALLVAGGIGAAPMPALVQTLRANSRAVTVLMGARTEQGLFCEDELRSLGAEVEVATDDGSRGRHGLVSQLVSDTLTQRAVAVYACGPAPMLAEVARIADDRGVPCQVSLESAIACGVGACMGCAVPSSYGGYRRVCVDGPVFDSSEIDWPGYVESVRRAGM